MVFPSYINDLKVLSLANVDVLSFQVLNASNESNLSKMKNHILIISNF